MLDTIVYGRTVLGYILYNQSSITTVNVNNGGGLPEPLCGVSPDPNRDNEVLKINCSRDDGTPIPSLTNRSSTTSQTSHGHKKLYVINVAVNEEGLYEGEYTLSVSNPKIVNCILPADCSWSEWGKCYGHRQSTSFN